MVYVWFVWVETLIIKLGLTGVYISFIFFSLKHKSWLLVRTMF